MFLRRDHLAVLVVAVSLAASAQPSYAQWQLNGVPLCTAVGSQQDPQIVSDMAHGAIVTWRDDRASIGSFNIYAQHVLSSGMVDPLWTANGTPVCITAPGIQSFPTIVSDGAHGAIVTWQDYRNNLGFRICAQRVDSAGVVQWTTNGVALCTVSGQFAAPMIVADGAGGAIVAWQDGRSAAYDVYAQRISATGVVDAAWPVNGRRLCTALGNQYSPTIVTDGTNGAIVTWEDTRNPTYDIYAQRVNGAGVVQWATDGVALCTAPGRQKSQTIATDGGGGAIVTWNDARPCNGCNSADIYTQRVDGAGVVRWATDGVLLRTAAGGEVLPIIVSDGGGGAIVTWQDAGYGIDAQRVDASGEVLWAATGVVLRAAGGSTGYPKIVTDMANGAVVTWWDSRSSAGICAQRVQASGEVDPACPTNGCVLRTGGESLVYPTIATDGGGGAIVTWEDTRNPTYDIYAQRIYGSGGVAAVAPGVPAYFAVHAPHPNPAHAAATINFDLPTAQRVSVGVYDVAGQLVRTLAGGGELPAGSHSIIWNGASDSGAPARAGIYFIRVSAKSAVETREVAIIP